MIVDLSFRSSIPTLSPTPPLFFCPFPRFLPPVPPAPSTRHLTRALTWLLPIRNGSHDKQLVTSAWDPITASEPQTLTAESQSYTFILYHDSCVVSLIWWRLVKILMDTRSNVAKSRNQMKALNCNTTEKHSGPVMMFCVT